MTTALSNLAVYSAQLAVLVATAALALRLLPLRVPVLLLRYWQLCAAAALLLPLMQPWVPTPAPTSLLTMLAGRSVSDAPHSTATSIDWARAAMLLIAVGGLFRIAWLIAGAVRLHRIVSRGTPSDFVVPGADVLLTGDIGSPATVGWRRPTILLPYSALALSREAQEAIVAHELAHVERRDWLSTIAEELWCAVFWFNPAARVLASNLSLARETVVDDLTIRRTRNRRAYAEALLAFADPQPHIIGATPLIGRRTLRQRISLIAQEVPMSRRRAALHLAIAASVVAATTSIVAAEWPMTTTSVSQTVYRPGNGVTLPAVVHEVKPVYTAEAKEHKIQGNVVMRVVVADTGDVGDVEITQSLDAEYGLDQQAILAARQWKFRPGTKDGKPVAVQVSVEMTFTLK